MNTIEIYKQLTTPESKKEEQKAKQDKEKQNSEFASGINAQQHSEWLQQPLSKEVILFLQNRYNKHIEVATAIAVGSSCEQERIEAVKQLVSANSILTTLKYVTRSN